MKRRFSFLADQSGVVQIILGGLAVIAFVSLAIGLWGLGTAGQAANSAIIPAEKYADSKSNADPSKGAANNRAIWRGMRGQAIEVAADALNPDDTGLTGIADSCGAFDSPDKNKAPGQIKNIEAKKQNDTKIGEMLKKNKLPTGQLTKDVVKGIQKIVETNSKPSADDKTKENAVIAIIMQILQDISDNKAKVPVIDTAKQELNNQKILADEKTANTKKQLNRALSEKEYIEKNIAANITDYNDLIAQGYTPENNLSDWQERLDYTNKQIAKLEGELAVLKSAENEKQGQDDTLTQDSTSESTAATEETTEETTAEEETTESTEPDETTTEPDANLIHGVVPTKVTGHGTVTDSHGVWDFYYEFWNVGKLGGEQYVEATFIEVLPNEDGGTITITFEGYFTGGPNGDGVLSGSIYGQTSTISIKLRDGKEFSMEGFSQFNCPIDNPQAFDGWVD